MTQGGGLTRKKQPEVVRRALLDQAARLAVEQGLAALTVQAVADAAGVTKGGFLHHFPSKKALIGAVFRDLMDSLDRELDALIDADPEAYGSFTRAYVETAFRIAQDIHGSSWSALSISVLTDPELRPLWADWFQARLERHHATDSDPRLVVVRLAADGVWLADLVALPLANREALYARLLQSTRAEAG